ncbi:MULTISPECIES: SDR family NAD(P)-dependent oxidoreductase [Cyanophyceae]|uniref:SDR family NAD(P)-dependent oxidoreductase n=1 Tax=Cyanophyceae TaxID=3028117 RepID=UPI00232E2EE5|nr:MULTISPECIES: glucose 1-dehydrogenase [Cyanophyceae]MDB9356773.1 glucose 1-dehydrogenase [Nodularia spumigena CS-587/03]MDB9305456.1 glucose 1-dehydrogenase [Nodularia spumigena CS-591/12]MDB9338814.1 glucose 1-dehydrogenase [Nodularia spumigena CS-589/07]MDB9398801.1 glucose 1-dehydrogenase [Microcystis aeruginosa CS-567/02-A1]MDB9497948.1 glucose 1-dehydrogenase [Nodularia spumigena CS-336/02]
MVKRLDNKVAIVTGAGTGIGEAIAHKFAKEGAAVIVNGLPDDPIEDVVRSIRHYGGKATVYSGDVSQENYAQGCVQTAINTYGKLNILINNAGVFLAAAETKDYPIDVFDQTIRMNIRSAFLMTKYALPHLQKTRGNIVSAGSEAGMNGLAFNTPYGGTKGWIHSFTLGVAVEQAKYGIRANCVCPGPIDTAWTHKETGPMDAQMEKTLIEGTPLARRGTPEEIANVYAFIASDEASYVTGALWLADGGITVGQGAIGSETPLWMRFAPKGELRLEHSLEGLENKETQTIK